MRKDPILCEDKTLEYCQKVISLNPNKSFEDLLDKVMKVSNGSCNPTMVRETLFKLLNNKKQRKYKDRWSEGIPHDPRSIKIYKGIEKIAFEEYGDYFGFKSGGDGDNGEILMYILDDYFEDEDNKG
jgi:hypothetical protein